MEYLDPGIVEALRRLAEAYSVEKIVLFGSRAKRTHHDRSDIDLAVWGIRDAVFFLDFKEALEEQAPTLLRFDIVDMNGMFVSDMLREEAAKDGVVLYEKV